ncbi:MAG: hypothetical protein QNJ37_06705 [Crocosphaera sp.]|nr:hypothetical protein [Crocosphaera sp.]
MTKLSPRQRANGRIGYGGLGNLAIALKKKDSVKYLFFTVLF